MPEFSKFDALLLMLCPLAACIGGFMHALMLEHKYDRLPRFDNPQFNNLKQALAKGSWLLFRLALSAVVGLLVALYFLGALKEETATLGKLLAFTILLGYAAPKFWVMQEQLAIAKAREILERKGPNQNEA